MKRKITIFLRFPLAAKAMLFEALLLLALARLAVVSLPFRWVARVLGRPTAEPPVPQYRHRRMQIRRIGKMVRRVSMHVPWTSKCLDQALAAKIMLARRGLATTVYFGVKNDESGELAAHAWLRCGRVYVTGGRNRNQYVTVNALYDEGA